MNDGRDISTRPLRLVGVAGQRSEISSTGVFTRRGSAKNYLTFATHSNLESRLQDAVATKGSVEVVGQGLLTVN